MLRYNRRNLTKWNMLVKSKSCVLDMVDIEQLTQRHILFVTVREETVREENELWEESNFSPKRKENQAGLRFLHTFNAKRQ